RESAIDSRTGSSSFAHVETPSSRSPRPTLGGGGSVNARAASTRGSKAGGRCQSTASSRALRTKVPNQGKRRAGVLLDRANRERTNASRFAPAYGPKLAQTARTRRSVRSASLARAITRSVQSNAGFAAFSSMAFARARALLVIA